MNIKKIIPKFVFSIYHFKLALLSALLYGFPGYKIKVIGITGTMGKSSTVILIGKILEEAGFKIAWMTSATIRVADKEILNPYHMTMPGRFAIQKFLKQAVIQKCDYAIIEVTSEGIKQFRHKFIDFKTAVFTNLKPEHIEAHGSFENYRACKGKLFLTTRNCHIVNIDDDNAPYFLKFRAKHKLFFSTKKQGADIVYACLKSGGFSIEGVDFNLKLLGNFNIYNALAAVSIAKSEGIDVNTCKRALEKVSCIPGRMELMAEKPYKIIVDLAHTPDSYEEVFKAVEAMSHKRVISVFGSAGGGRDKWKRPVLGRIASQHSDIVILCNEDPYNENPEDIIKDIKKGIDNFCGFEILDRKEAIKKALDIAEDNDIVLILGKGTEQLMFLPSGKIHWDDREVVKEILTQKR
ncbi:UDP-N-acetylmuramoyl-L-alanyl-D-glutamate--2,6-diaminopimelate ligase [Patescibacteria group bacterium]|nr:UDP-N-acetylmuramoyl-L-alanyl-D-glutamate--2,6-diaminopimelate ligase [Patescibacteria group bacterium]